MRVGGSIHLPPLALTLARRERFDESLALLTLERHALSASATLEVLCEIAAMRERWDEAAELVAAAREEAEIGEQLALPLFADRLEGRAARANGDAAAAAALFSRSATGFGTLGARWEEAWSRLLLAEVVEAPQAERELAAALTVFESLGSVAEAARAGSLPAVYRAGRSTTTEVSST